MKIAGYIWLEEIVEKLEAKHQVFPDEVEEVFGNRPSVKRMNQGHFRGEDVYRALGKPTPAVIWLSFSSSSCPERR